MFHSLYREEIDQDHGGEEEEGPEPICSNRAVIVSRQKAVCSLDVESIVHSITLTQVQSRRMARFGAERIV
jgi:hypothetical protein